MRKLILSEIERSIKVKKNILKEEKVISQLEVLANNCLKSIRKGGKIIFCGNGGSFADSQHLAAEFISRLRFDRAPISSIALGTNNSNLSAIANDYGYDEVFSREIIALGNEDDVFIPISTSGDSPNIIKAIKLALRNNIKTSLWTGNHKLEELSNLNDLIILKSTSKETALIQEQQLILGHIFCGLLEDFVIDNEL